MATATKKKTVASKLKKVVKTASKKPSKTGDLKFNARAVTEISATFKDTPGLTAKVAAALAGENVNILAGTGMSASAMYRQAVFTFIVDDFEKAEKALESIGAFDVEPSSVILVDMPNKVGALEKAAGVIAKAKINIFYFYATTSSGDTATCVFKTVDDKKAIRILNKA